MSDEPKAKQPQRRGGKKDELEPWTVTHRTDGPNSAMVTPQMYAQLERELAQCRKVLRELMVYVLDEYVPEFTSKQKMLAIEAAKKEAGKCM